MISHSLNAYQPENRQIIVHNIICHVSVVGSRQNNLQQVGKPKCGKNLQLKMYTRLGFMNFKIALMQKIFILATFLQTKIFPGILAASRLNCYRSWICSRFSDKTLLGIDWTFERPSFGFCIGWKKMIFIILLD